MLDQSLEDSTKPTAMLDPPFAEERSRPALTPLESQTLRRLRTYWPELAEPFREHIRKGRRGIFRLSLAAGPVEVGAASDNGTRPPVVSHRQMDPVGHQGLVRAAKH